MVALAFGLRLWGLGNESFSNDELSALLRLQYGSLAEVLAHGVAPDGHPALVQVFLYCWTRAIGTSELALRLPFVLASVGAAALLARAVGRVWGRPAGWVALALFASLEPLVALGRLARPYAFGLFFVCAAIWAFVHIANWAQGHPPRRQHYVVFGFALAASALTHYFAGLQAALLFGFGAWWAKRKTPYFFAGLGALALFSPHILLTLNQLQTGGLKWAAPPALGFFWQHWWAVFHASGLVIGGLAALVVAAWATSAFPFNPKSMLQRLWWFALAWLPLSIGYAYSVLRAPVLHGNAVAFALPFALGWLASFFTGQRRWHPYAWLVVGGGLVISLLAQRDFFGHPRHPSFKQTASLAAEWLQGRQRASGVVIGDFNNSFYIEYYNRMLAAPVRYDLHRLEADLWPLDSLFASQALPPQWALVAWAHKVPTDAHWGRIREWLPSLSRWRLAEYAGLALFKAGQTALWADSAQPASNTLEPMQNREFGSIGVRHKNPRLPDYAIAQLEWLPDTAAGPPTNAFLVIELKDSADQSLLYFMKPLSDTIRMPSGRFSTRLVAGPSPQKAAELAAARHASCYWLAYVYNPGKGAFAWAKLRAWGE